MEMNDYEAARQARIEMNRQKMISLGLDAAAKAVQKSVQPALESVPKRKKRVPSTPGDAELRKSDRKRDPNVSYKEDPAVDDFFGTGSWVKRKKYGSSATFLTLDEEAARQARIDAGVVLDHDAAPQHGPGATPSKAGSCSATPRKRGPQDSGKGKVYDSKFGVTCHWCRQKTLADSVTCTHPNCGNGKRMPTTFCGRCLKVRHGEDFAAARASQQWVCPPCRGSCGKGCIRCCNCGPCRKKAGLEPTGQIKQLFIEAGFDNAHDYLVHKATGEDAATIAARKVSFDWGKWLLHTATDDDDAAAEASPASPHEAGEALAADSEENADPAAGGGGGKAEDGASAETAHGAPRLGARGGAVGRKKAVGQSRAVKRKAAQVEAEVAVVDSAVEGAGGGGAGLTPAKTASGDRRTVGESPAPQKRRKGGDDASRRCLDFAAEPDAEAMQPGDKGVADKQACPAGDMAAQAEADKDASDDEFDSFVAFLNSSRFTAAPASAAEAAAQRPAAEPSVNGEASCFDAGPAAREVLDRMPPPAAKAMGLLAAEKSMESLESEATGQGRLVALVSDAALPSVAVAGASASSFAQ